MRDVSVIEVNLSDLDHNVRVLRGIVDPEPGHDMTCQLCPIVKADAYGLGAPRVAKRLAQNGADLLAVYTADQAAELFRAAIGARVLVLMPVREIARVDELYRGLVTDQLQLTVHDLEHVSDLIAITERYGVTISVHLEIDTGMSRGGCSVEDAAVVLKRIASCRRLKLAGIFTHFASAESDLDFTESQLARFDELMRQQTASIAPGCRVHVGSSFATLRHRRYHKTMVRIGLAWAGYGPEWMKGSELISAARELRPIVTWKSRIVQVKTVPPGTPVGYGSRWTAKRTSMIGLVPVGYADGYPIGLGSRDGRLHGASVAILDPRDGGETIGFAPVVGAVNMDQITVDLTDLARSGSLHGCHIGQGTSVELISAEADAPNHLPTLAAMAGTIPHEMLCRLNPRLKRVYTTTSGALQAAEPANAMAG